MIKLVVFDFHNTLTLRSGKTNRIFSLLFEKNIGDKIKINKEELNIGINDLKNTLKPYKTKSWYDAMKKINMDPEIMMPTLDEIIHFIKIMKNLNPNTVFGVASMIEEEFFIYDLLKYCFEERGVFSPFTHETIVSSSGLKEAGVKSQNAHDKWPHIEVILKRNNLNDVKKSEIVMIDDNSDVIEFMSSLGVCSVHVSEYFTIEEWNKGCYVKEEI